MAITLVPKRHSPRARPGTDDLGSVKARISALVSSLRCFDVTTIEHRGDWKANAFATLINATLADIFDQNSQECEEYSVQSFDTLPPTTDVEYPLLEVRRGYQKGINAAAQKLNLLLDTLDKELRAADGVTAPAPQAGATAASSLDEKVSLITLRAKMGNRHAPSATVDATAPGRGKAIKARPGTGVAKERVIDGQPGEPQPKGGMAGARNRGGADILGKNGKEPDRRKVDKAQAEALFLEYVEAMQMDREAEGPGEEQGAHHEPESTAHRPDEKTPMDMAAVVLAADALVAATIQPGTQEEEDSHPFEPEAFVPSESAYQEPCEGSLPDNPPGDEPGKEAPLPIDEAIVLGNDELPSP